MIKNLTPNNSHGGTKLTEVTKEDWKSPELLNSSSSLCVREPNVRRVLCAFVRWILSYLLYLGTSFKTILVFSYLRFKRRFFCLLGLVFFLLPLNSQDLNGEKSAEGYIFPLALVLEGAEYVADVWKPDWPLEIPPDAFKVVSGEISSCEIMWDDFSLGYEFDEEGKALIFPLVMNGKFAQAALTYVEGSGLSEIAVTFPSGDDPWNMEFLEYRNTFPYLVRVCCGDGTSDSGLWYFIYYSWGISEILETWYDENGKTVGIYGFTLAEVGRKPRIRAIKDYSDPESGTELFYDSRGLVTGLSEPAGTFNVLYFRENSPRYWERRPVAGDASDGNAEINAALDATLFGGNFSFQWDEAGFLKRLSREDENADIFIDYRYEYTLDERGNWIERRETRMIRDLGLLVPSPGTTFRRVLEYKK